MQAKRSLTRLVRTPEGVLIDTQGKLPGRGAYLHDLRTCWEKGLKGSLARSLKTELTDEDRQRLNEHMKTLPEQEPLETLPQAAALADE